MVEQYLRTCVTAYAAVLDGIDPGDVPASSDHAAAGGDGPLHGSIAFSQDDDGAYAWGIAWSFDSAAGAQSEALGQCREYGGTRCAQAGWFQEACGALAIGSGNGYGAGWGATVAEAERDALAQCRARLNDDCRIEVARCSQSEEAGGSGQLDREDTAVSRDTAGTADASCGAWEATYTVVWKEEGLRRGGQNFSDAAWGETKAEAEDSGQNQCIFYGGGEWGLLLESCVVSEAKCVQPQQAPARQDPVVESAQEDCVWFAYVWIHAPEESLSAPGRGATQSAAIEHATNYCEAVLRGVNGSCEFADSCCVPNTGQAMFDPPCDPDR